MGVQKSKKKKKIFFLKKKKTILLKKNFNTSSFVKNKHFTQLEKNLYVSFMH